MSPDRCLVACLTVVMLACGRDRSAAPPPTPHPFAGLPSSPIPQRESRTIGAEPFATPGAPRTAEPPESLESTAAPAAVPSAHPQLGPGGLSTPSGGGFTTNAPARRDGAFWAPTTPVTGVPNPSPPGP